MKRRIAAAILVTLLPLGMAACGSQSKAEACKLLEKPLNDAGLALVNSAQNGDAASLADTYTTFATTYEEASKKITNKEIKESVDQVAAGWRAAADNSGILKADPMSMDVQKLEEYQKIMEDLSAKQTELFNKGDPPDGCAGGEWGGGGGRRGGPPLQRYVSMNEYLPVRQSSSSAGHSWPSEYIEVVRRAISSLASF